MNTVAVNCCASNGIGFITGDASFLYTGLCKFCPLVDLLLMTEAGTEGSSSEHMDSHATQSGIHTAAATSSERFTVDDAFSDDGEDVANFEFSSEAVRKERKRIGADGTQDDEESVHTSPPPSHSSISTFNLDQDAYSEKGITHSPRSLPEDVRESCERERSRTPEGRVSKAEDVENEIAFPSVVIDLSQSPSHQVTVLSGAEAAGDAARAAESLDKLSISSTNGELPSLQSKNKLPASSATGHVHRPSRTAGPSALEKVISKTRPAYLPPKPKEEDVKHMIDWEKMMKQSRLAGALFTPALSSFAHMRQRNSEGSNARNGV